MGGPTKATEVLFLERRGRGWGRQCPVTSTWSFVVSCPDHILLLYATLGSVRERRV